MMYTMPKNLLSICVNFTLATQRLVQGNEIQPEHFEPDEETGGILLTAQGMRIFIRKMEGKFESTSKYLKDVSTSLRRCFYLQSVDFTKAVEERNASLYQPVIIR